jgi:hypothetical protein
MLDPYIVVEYEAHPGNAICLLCRWILVLLNVVREQRIMTTATEMVRSHAMYPKFVSTGELAAKQEWYNDFV